MSDNELECPVCLDTLTRPRILPCGHTLCEGCIKQLINGQNIMCPEDRSMHPTPHDGAQGFPQNFLAAKMIDKLCQGCRQIKPDSRCSHCEKLLCGSCIEGHRQLEELHKDMERLIELTDVTEKQLEGIKKDTQAQHDALLVQIDRMRDDLQQRVNTRIKQLKADVATHIEQSSDWQRSTEAKLTHVKNNLLNTPAIQTMDFVNANAEVTALQKHCKQEISELQQLLDVIPRMKLQLSYDMNPVDAVINSLGTVSTTAKITKRRQSLNCGEQKIEISDVLKTQKKMKGDTWFLVDSKWFKQWKKYVGYDSWDTAELGHSSVRPGPIDNVPLYQEGSLEILKEGLIEDLDYVLLPQSAWDKLVEWYGMVDGQVAINRIVIDYGMFVKHCKVEVYLIDLKLCRKSDTGNCVVKRFSRADTVGHVENVMRNIFHIGRDKQVKVWNRYKTKKTYIYEELKTPQHTVQDVRFTSGEIIAIEEV